MSKDPIILYDLPSKEPCVAWSLNPWKTRLILNYKGLDYKTAWTEYPDINKVVAHNLPSGKDTHCTCPTVQLPGGEWVMESWEIAKRLEALYPEKSLDLTYAKTEPMKKIIGDIWGVIKADTVNKVATRFLNPPSKEYFLRTREEVFGMPLDKLEREKGGQHVYEKAADLVKQVGSWYKEDTSGPFLQGKKVCYADFVYVAFLQCLHRLGDDVYDPFVNAGGDPEPHLAVFKACGPWLERADH